MDEQWNLVEEIKSFPWVNAQPCEERPAENCAMPAAALWRRFIA